MAFTQLRNPVELLLPVGTKEMALAAIHNGADAIFMGVPGFNARGRSHDFEINELREIIDLCHLNGVKVNLAFNIVIYQEELSRARELLYQILPLRPDAIIVQDLGLVRLIREIAPDQRIHASTQMTVTNFEAIELLADLNIQRFVLGRENSIDEIKEIRNKTSKELEVFVHGALCVSYSGQCFTSESIGGRSANRGQCAQSCRFSYDLFVDGQKKSMGERKYLVSPQDLCGLEEVPELIQAGVNCFKVEGRLKTPEYVATSARAYKSAIEQNEPLNKEWLENEKRKMGTTYSRGFFSGWLNGVNHQKLVDGSFSSHRGFEIGKINEVGLGFFNIKLNDPLLVAQLKPGDGILWVPEGSDQEFGSFIYAVTSFNKNVIRVEVSRETQIDRGIIGAKVFQNHDKDLKKEVSQSVDDKNKKRRSSLDFKIWVEKDQPLKVEANDGYNSVIQYSTSKVEAAKTKGVTREALVEELSALGGTVFRAGKFEFIDFPNESLFIMNKELKEVRRNLVESLSQLRVQPSTQKMNSPQSVIDWMNSEKINESGAVKSKVRLNILLREKQQVEDFVVAIESHALSIVGINAVILDFEFGRDYAASVELLKRHSIKVGLATTRILKPNEHRNLKVLAQLNPDLILVRNLGALSYFQKNTISKDCSLIGDFSLNVTNHLTASYLLNKGLDSVSLSYDLNHLQVSEVLSSGMGNKIEITAFQYMPSFHMEHCVFAAFLSQGTSFKDCGKPCEKHRVELKDQFGNFHQIKPDQECRNTMFNAKSQSAAGYLGKWSEEGLGFARYEALYEKGDILIQKIKAHLDFIAGQIDLNELKAKVGSIETYGLSEGALSRTKEYSSHKKSPIKREF